MTQIEAQQTPAAPATNYSAKRQIEQRRFGPSPAACMRMPIVVAVAMIVKQMR